MQQLFFAHIRVFIPVFMEIFGRFRHLKYKSPNDRIKR